MFSFAVDVIYRDEMEIDCSNPEERDWKFLIRKTEDYVPEEEVRLLAATAR